MFAKLGIVAAYASMIWMMVQFKKADQNVKLEFDLLSRIELSAGAGINLVGLICVIDASTYTFSLILCLLGICIALLQRYRIILAGDTKILFGAKVHSIKEIKSLGSGMLTLIIQTKKRAKPYRIYVPLTSNNVLKNRVQAKLKVKNKQRSI